MVVTISEFFNLMWLRFFSLQADNIMIWYFICLEFNSEHSFRKVTAFLLSLFHSLADSYWHKTRVK